MNWRRGWQRLARVAGWSYLAITLVSLIAIARDASDEQPTIQVTTEYGRCYVVHAWAPAEARDVVNQYVRATPAEQAPPDPADQYPGCLLVPQDSYADLRWTPTAAARAVAGAAAWFGGVLLGWMVLARAAGWVIAGFAEPKEKR